MHEEFRDRFRIIRLDETEGFQQIPNRNDQQGRPENDIWRLHT